MDEPAFRSTRVAILGLGLMGGSLALALRAQGVTVYAADPDPATRDLAASLGAAERIAAHPQDVLPDADAVILAAPVRAILDLLRGLPHWHPGEAVVMDIGSTKAAICRAMAALPPRFDPIGGHPIAGKAVAGLGHADATLYRGAPFVFTPLERTGAAARAFAKALCRALSAHPLWMDAETHDHWIAATSHLPYLVSLALTLATPEETAPLIGPGFRSTSRLASSSPRMMADIIATNRAPIQEALHRFRAALERIEEIIESDAEPMEAALALGAAHHARLVFPTPKRPVHE